MQKFGMILLVLGLPLVVMRGDDSSHVEENGHLPDFESLANSFSLKVRDFLNTALSMLRSLPSHYRNASSEILHKNGTDYLQNTTIMKLSENTSFYEMFQENTTFLGNQSNETDIP
ncbi:uncharacterized protein LOC125658997 isoform X4 [Ostrea edulis]|nr:uncharacterized protein LOC125658997 isoform X4 [Ostrea edulis]